MSKRFDPPVEQLQRSRAFCALDRAPLFRFSPESIPPKFFSIFRSILLILLLVVHFPLKVAASDPNVDLKEDEDAIGPRVLQGIRNPETSEHEFLVLLELLPHIAVEPSETWAGIVADDRYDSRKRRLAMAVLLRRHVSSHLSLLELARLIPNNHLFEIDDIKPVKKPRTKERRPKFWLEGSVFFAQMVPGTNGGAGAAFYFVLDRKAKSARALLFSALQGQQSSELKSIHLLDLKSVWDWGPTFMPFP